MKQKIRLKELATMDKDIKSYLKASMNKEQAEANLLNAKAILIIVIAALCIIKPNSISTLLAGSLSLYEILKDGP